MPQVIDKRSGKRVTIADAAKKFRSSGFLTPDVSSLGDDQIVQRMVQDYGDVYSIEADAVPATPAPPNIARTKFASTERNRGAVKLEDALKQQPGEFVGNWLGNFGTGAVNTVKDIGNFIVGVPDMIKVPIDRKATIYVMAQQLKQMNPADPGYAQLHAQMVEKTREGQMPSLSQIGGAIADEYGQKYGSPYAIAKTLYENPFDVASDVATIATGVAGLGRFGAKAAGTVAAKTATSMPTVANAMTKAASAATKGEELARTVATFADPVYAPIAAAKGVDNMVSAKFGVEPLRKQAALGMYKFAAALPDKDPDRVRRAALAGIGEDGLNLNYFDESGKGFLGLNIPRHIATKIGGDAPIRSAIDVFDEKKIKPLVARRVQIADDLTASGAMIDGQQFYNDVWDAFQKAEGTTGTNIRKRVQGFLQDYLDEKGIIDPYTGTVRDLTPKEAHEIMGGISATSSQRLNALAHKGAQMDIDSADRFIVDNEMRKALRKQLGALSPEYDDLGSELTSRIRLKQQAQRVRNSSELSPGVRDLEDPVISMSPSEVFALVSSISGGANAMYARMKIATMAVNKFSPISIPKIARAFYADPKTKDMASLILRNAGYEAADIGKILGGAEARARRDVEKFNLHRPRTEYDELAGTPIDETKVNARVPKAPPRTAPPPGVATGLPERLWP